MSIWFSLYGHHHVLYIEKCCATNALVQVFLLHMQSIYALVYPIAMGHYSCALNMCCHDCLLISNVQQDATI
jgi:hypothetical protein